ncbi:MAG: hypothetical protein CGU29_03235 [Candidatus Dactylopiibacterium carminicum]|uniref:PAS domain-containing protein n=1 Tax=Candidatus Dactylopiibacterium carminicum TaxID=857335 RepID=A0A272EWY6_9RHOO|nr:PAS domain-containing protein [Candidatus Dactylopiibacterium carminicum]KAF7600054.1 hypothetical protein BGI27_04760 [Candidatus Dactylopiibacterium carminicum]PAS94556.1 MAG: hypothetical protein CGU29_03235 [Candidatus Dactylopiibacterium carminicum]PAT00057.1 MAG: hypothetical protein BSR46_04785 [Candidatus Dactylopiibacterium carminicum]
MTVKWLLEGGALLLGLMAGVAWWRARRALLQARDAVLEQEKAVCAFTQALIDVMPHPVYVRDAQGHFVLINTAYAESQDLPAEKIVGHTSAQILPDADHAADIAREDAEVLAGRQIYKEVVSRFGFAGVPRNLVVAKRACRGTHGEPLIVGTYVDVTPWREAEQALQASLAREVARRERTQAFVQRMIDLIPQPFYVKDAQSRFLMVNDAQMREMGVSREQIIGLRSYEWMLGREPELVRVVQEKTPRCWRAA